MAERKKIGLMTCFLNNYGACLQAYALQTVIESFGFQCEIIRFTEPNGYSKTKPLVRTITQKIKNNKLYYCLRFAIDPHFAKHNKLNGYRVIAFRRFRSKFLHLTKEDYTSYESLKKIAMDYSAFVCGSDQIWNPTFYNKCNPGYYLYFVPDRIKKIAYAPSIGLSHIPDEYLGDFIKYVNRLDWISCREQLGCELIRNLTGKAARHVVDPTLLLARNDWERIVSRRIHVKPYVLCYLFGQQRCYSELIDRAVEHFNCEAVYIPFFEEDLLNPYRKITDRDPAGFLELIKHAKYIITDSFHAVVFSILFRKDFSVFFRNATEDPNSMNSRIDSILTKLNLTDRLVFPNKVDRTSFSPVANYDEVHTILDMWRNDSLFYLEEALKDD